MGERGSYQSNTKRLPSILHTENSPQNSPKEFNRMNRVPNTGSKYHHQGRATMMASKYIEAKVITQKLKSKKPERQL